jgi:hypothetical protein
MRMRMRGYVKCTHARPPRPVHFQSILSHPPFSLFYSGGLRLTYQRQTLQTKPGEGVCGSTEWEKPRASYGHSNPASPECPPPLTPPNPHGRIQHSSTGRKTESCSPHAHATQQRRTVLPTQSMSIRSRNAKYCIQTKRCGSVLFFYSSDLPYVLTCHLGSSLSCLSNVP